MTYAVRDLNTNENVSIHQDRDEAIASAKRYMRRTMMEAGWGIEGNSYRYRTSVGMANVLILRPTSYGEPHDMGTAIVPEGGEA